MLAVNLRYHDGIYSKSDGVQDLAFESEERSFWVTAASQKLSSIGQEKREVISLFHHVKVEMILANQFH